MTRRLEQQAQTDEQGPLFGRKVLKNFLSYWHGHHSPTYLMTGAHIFPSIVLKLSINPLLDVLCLICMILKHVWYRHSIK